MEAQAPSSYTGFLQQPWYEHLDTSMYEKVPNIFLYMFGILEFV